MKKKYKVVKVFEGMTQITMKDVYNGEKNEFNLIHQAEERIEGLTSEYSKFKGYTFTILTIYK